MRIKHILVLFYRTNVEVVGELRNDEVVFFSFFHVTFWLFGDAIPVL